MASSTSWSAMPEAEASAFEGSALKRPKVLDNRDETNFYELASGGGLIQIKPRGSAKNNVCPEKGGKNSENDENGGKNVEKSRKGGKSLETVGSMECENLPENEQLQEAQLAVVNENEQARGKENENAQKTVMYPHTFKGEIFVLVDSSECPNIKNEKITTGLTLLSQIKDMRHKDVEFIYALGKTLYKVTFKNTYAANTFVLDDKLPKRGLKPFIPRTALEIYGVVRGVPTCFSDSDFLNNAISSIPIRSVRRFTRKDPATNEYVPITTLKIGFSGNEIPKQIIYEYTKLDEVNWLQHD
ncbi:uncharacterized protein LOC118741562 [Rhagoletis pomonella]|uniref:uncharacterized protein LOC118741562 n=1 Tax=Rhagoletis pomonella TaxID=28610 RepID=UPI00177C3226|nr:uncharacterized protein LOC118741562 [Rhagoletis pomonella]